MPVVTLTRRAAPVLDEDATASAIRLESDVRAALCGIAPRRAEQLTRATGNRYRAALAASGPDVWEHFAAAIKAVLRAAHDAPVEAGSSSAGDARRRLRGFLAENPDLGRNAGTWQPQG
jgi:hypothetical protein